MDDMEERPIVDPLEGFIPILAAAEIVGAVVVILVTVWAGHYHGGFSWRSNPGVEFNWHPVLMTAGLIFLYANSILIYRVLRHQRKLTLKLWHMGIHVFTFFMVVIGLQAVFDSHNLSVPPTPNLYSLHSWIGLTAVILFCCQLVAGFVAFLYPKVPSPVRSAYLPVHVFFGLAGFVLSVVAALLGISEKANWTIKNISDLPPEGLLVNFIGIFLVIFTGLVVYLVTEERYKREPVPEDEHLLTPRQ